MRTVHLEDIWSAHENGYYIVIPTNGFLKPSTGECVMGRGLAWQAQSIFPELPAELGARIKEHGNHVYVFVNHKLITFPVKHVYWEKADANLIQRSCMELMRLVQDCQIFGTIYVPKVGCGNGKLDWKDVKPILEASLDDRFVVVE